MKWPLSTNFYKLISRSADKATPQQYTLPYLGLLTGGKEYYWRVRAKDEKGVWSPWSKTFSFTAKAPNYPQGVALSYDKDKAIGTLRWKANTADNLTATYWNSAPPNRDQWIVYDLGAEQTFQYIVLVPFQHKVEYNIRKYAFDISSDGRSFRRLTAGENNDSGSIFIYELDPPAKARYLRFNMLENFPDDGLAWTSDSFVFSDLWVANLVPRSRGQQAATRASAPSEPR